MCVCVPQVSVRVCTPICTSIVVFEEDSAVPCSRNKKYGKVKHSLEHVYWKYLSDVSQPLTEGSFRKFSDNTFVFYNLYVDVVLGGD